MESGVLEEALERIEEELRDRSYWYDMQTEEAREKHHEVCKKQARNALVDALVWLAKKE